MAKVQDLDLNVNVRTMFAELAELIPARARTVVYAAAIAVALLALAVQWAAGIWWPELDDRVDRTTAGIVAVALLVVSVLATVYRPTRAGQALPAVPVDEAAYAQEAQARTIDVLVHAGYDADHAARAVTAGDLSQLHRGVGTSA